VRHFLIKNEFMKKISFLFFGLFFLAAAQVSAQEYQTAIGAKFYVGDGSSGGINIRHSLSSNTAVEGSLLFFSGAIGLEGLYEFQGPIRGAEGLQYFVGGGGLLSFGTGNHDNSTGFALRLTGGLDYRFTDAPISISLGLDPFFYLAPSTSSNLALGIGFRYVLP
jgi:hypothetical protein